MNSHFEEYVQKHMEPWPLLKKLLDTPELDQQYGYKLSRRLHSLLSNEHEVYLYAIEADSVAFVAKKVNDLKLEMHDWNCKSEGFKIDVIEGYLKNGQARNCLAVPLYWNFEIVQVKIYQHEEAPLPYIGLVSYRNVSCHKRN